MPTTSHSSLLETLDVDTLANLLAKYIAPLPKLKGSEKSKQIDLKITDGVRENVFEKELETPNAISVFMYKAPMAYTLKNAIMVSMLEQSMDMLYTESVREDEGGAYGVPVSGNIEDYPENIAIIQIQLPTAPEKRERMTEIIYKGVDDVCANGPKEEYPPEYKGVHAPFARRAHQVKRLLG